MKFGRFYSFATFKNGIIFAVILGTCTQCDDWQNQEQQNQDWNNQEQVNQEWQNQDLFMKDFALGCPPDYFSKDGQRGGFAVLNPKSDIVAIINP